MEPSNTELFEWDKHAVDLLPLCQSKADDFHLLGYKEVTAQEVYDCVKGILKGRGALHEVVALILGMSIGQFMNYMTMSAYRGNLGDGLFDGGKRS